MTAIASITYLSLISISWVAGIAGLFKLNDWLGFAGFCFWISTWVKSWLEEKAKESQAVVSPVE